MATRKWTSGPRCTATIVASALLGLITAGPAASQGSRTFEMREIEQGTALTQRVAKMKNARNAAAAIRWMGRNPDFTVTKKAPDPAKQYGMERGETYLLFWLNGPCNPIEISDAGGKLGVASEGRAMCFSDGADYPAERLPDAASPIWCKNSPKRPFCKTLAK